jgi:hypothetical protein
LKYRYYGGADSQSDGKITVRSSGTSGAFADHGKRPNISVPNTQMGGGTEQSEPLHDFIESVESTAKVGNWSKEDMVRIAGLKLTDTAKSFFSAAAELHEPMVTWEAFRKALENRFKDPRTKQFHRAQLQTAKQQSNEGPQDFADRIRRLARKVTPSVADPEAQRTHTEEAEQIMLTCFTSGLKGKLRKRVRFSFPNTFEEAIQLAIIVDQAEAQEQRIESFYTDK